MSGVDPVSNVSTALTAGFSLGEAITALITKTLPSDEDKTLAFKAKYPKLYVRVRTHTLQQMFRYLKHHRSISVPEYVDFVGGVYSDQDKKDLVNMLTAELSGK